MTAFEHRCFQLAIEPARDNHLDSGILCIIPSPGEGTNIAETAYIAYILWSRLHSLVCIAICHSINCFAYSLTWSYRRLHPPTHTLTARLSAAVSDQNGGQQTACGRADDRSWRIHGWVRRSRHVTFNKALLLPTADAAAAAAHGCETLRWQVQHTKPANCMSGCMLLQVRANHVWSSSRQASWCGGTHMLRFATIWQSRFCSSCMHKLQEAVVTKQLLLIRGAHHPHQQQQQKQKHCQGLGMHLALSALLCTASQTAAGST